MDLIKNLFPISLNACDLKGLLISILIYIVVNFVGGLVLGLLDGIPLIGFVFGVCGWILNVYCAAGIIVALLYFFKIVK